MKRPPIPWSEAEIAYLKEHSHGQYIIQTTATLNERFGTNRSSDSVKGKMYKLGLVSGMDTHFYHAHSNKPYIPPKGVHFLPETEFKGGQNKLPVGSVRTRTEKSGHTRKTVYIKIAEPNKWENYGRYVFRMITGHDIPRGYVLVHKNRDYNDCRFDNLRLLSRQEALGLNHYNMPDYNENNFDAVVMLSKIRLAKAEAKRRYVKHKHSKKG